MNHKQIINALITDWSNREAVHNAITAAGYLDQFTKGTPVWRHWDTTQPDDQGTALWVYHPDDEADVDVGVFMNEDDEDERIAVC